MFIYALSIYGRLTGISTDRYKHCVINNVISNSLLRSVREEIMSNIHFTPKHTDIYTIYQSGDLVNISGLTEEERKLLPSLSKLRDALYSQVFRDYIERVTT
jgi:prolyl 3-hydroxylase /prolyl 3,4-dihydroxylase